MIAMVKEIRIIKILPIYFEVFLFFLTKMAEEKKGRGRPVGFMTKEKIAQKKAFEELKETILRSQKTLLKIDD